MRYLNAAETSRRVAKRYISEAILGRRSSIRRLCEGDLPPSARMVLLVADVRMHLRRSKGTPLEIRLSSYLARWSPVSMWRDTFECGVDTAALDGFPAPEQFLREVQNGTAGIALTLTDLWYGCGALTDPVIAEALLHERLCEGDKLEVSLSSWVGGGSSGGGGGGGGGGGQGFEPSHPLVNASILTGKETGAPLPSFGGGCLQLHANACRRVQMTTKVGAVTMTCKNGVQKRPGWAPCRRLSTLRAMGGMCCDIDVVIVRAYPLLAWEPPASADDDGKSGAGGDDRGILRPPLAERARLRLCHASWSSAYRRLEAEFENAFEEQMAQLYEESQLECAAGTQAGFMFDMQKQQLAENLKAQFHQRCESEYRAVYGARAEFVHGEEPVAVTEGARRTSLADKDIFNARSGARGNTTTGVTYVATFLVVDRKHWLASGGRVDSAHSAILKIWGFPPEGHPLATVDGSGSAAADKRRETVRRAISGWTRDSDEADSRNVLGEGAIVRLSGLEARRGKAGGPLREKLQLGASWGRTLRFEPMGIAPVVRTCLSARAIADGAVSVGTDVDVVGVFLHAGDVHDGGSWDTRVRQWAFCVDGQSWSAASASRRRRSSGGW